MKGLKRMQTNKQRGAVSIFVVIFAMLLFTAVSVGFTVLMLRDQNRATDNDLSQSALDSSRAGIEDAKRVLAQYNECLDSEVSAGSPTDCSRLVDKVRDGACDTVGSVIGSPGQETIIKQGATGEDAQLQQAYTCVKIQPDTEDVVKVIKNEGDIKIVPLKAKGDYDTVEVSWVEKGDGAAPFDFSASTKDGDGLAASNLAEILPKEGDWKKEWGSILRVQAFSYTPGDVNLEEIDRNARTAFLYPTDISGAATSVDMNTVDLHTPLPPFGEDASGLNAHNAPQLIECDTTTTDEYACTATLTNVRPDGDDTAYLAIAGIYAGSGDSFKVRMLNGSDTVLFDGVQPIIDSTGRANDVFRRVQARVETSSSQEDAMPLPRAALGTRGEICKNYIIADSHTDYNEGSGCGEGAPVPTQQPSGAAPADGEVTSDTPAPGGGGGGAGAGSTPPAGGGAEAGIPAPYNLNIGGKEYTITPRLKVERECSGFLFNRTCTDVRYAEHVYTATEERCTGPFWNRTCRDTQVEKIHKKERL